MGDEEDPEARAFQADQHVEHVDPGRGVEHADDLVSDEKLDVQQQGPGHQEALLLAAGELVGELVQDVGRVEGHRLQRRRRLWRPIPARERPEKYSWRNISNTRSALYSGLYELKGSWNTPCTCR